MLKEKFNDIIKTIDKSSDMAVYICLLKHNGYLHADRHADQENEAIEKFLKDNKINFVYYDSDSLGTLLQPVETNEITKDFYGKKLTWKEKVKFNC